MIYFIDVKLINLNLGIKLQRILQLIKIFQTFIDIYQKSR